MSEKEQSNEEVSSCQPTSDPAMKAEFDDHSQEKNISISKVDYDLLQKDSTELKEMKDKLLRTAADFENAKKRLEKQKEEIIQFANKSILSDFLPILDNLERALKSAQGNPAGNGLLQGVEMIYKQLIDILKNHGLEKIASIGTMFDPNHHETIGTVETDDYKEDTVVEEISAGYLYKGKLLKPALVKISTAKMHQ